MKKLLWLLLLAPLFHVEHAQAAAPLQIYCIQSTSTPCNTVSNPGSGSQGDTAWLFSGKTNSNFNFLSPLWAIPAGQYVCNPTGTSGAIGYCTGGGGGITGVTAGTGLSGGGTSGNVTVNMAPTGVGSGTCTNCNLTYNALGEIVIAANGSSGGSVAFSGITSGSNTNHLTMNGAGILDFSSGGQIIASSVALTGITGMGTGCSTWLATPSSANLLSCVTDETGTSKLVFSNTPLLTTPQLTGSSTGVTTLASANAGASNFTITFPAITDTVTTNTATQTLTNKSISGSQITSAVANATAAVTTTNISGGTNNQVPVQTGVGATGFITAASSGYLHYNGTTFVWDTPGTGAASVTPGTTTVIGASAPCLLDNSSGTVMGCASVSQTLSLNSGVLGTTVPQRTVTTSPAVGAGDMGGVIYLNITGGGTVTLPAISSTVFATGMSVSLVNYSASTAGISTTPTVNAGGGCVSGTGIPAGDTWEIVSNGATLDCNQTLSAATGGGTVTHTGSLTANAVVIGNGTADTKVVSGITTDGVSALNLGVPGTSVGKTVYGNATSGTITVQAPTGALGTITNTLQAAGDTFVYRATTDTLTNKTISGASNTLSNIALSSLATQAANTVVMNATGSSASPTAVTTVTYLIDTGTTFTAAGTGACATRSTLTGGTSAGRLTCTGTTGASTVTITLPTATNGWRCSMDDETTANTLRQTGQSATTCAISGTVNANDVLTFSAIGY